MTPLLRRSTHLYCVYCYTNLYDYGQIECDNCRLPFDKEYMLSGFDKTSIHIILRTYLFFKSNFFKFKYRITRGQKIKIE